MTEPTLDQRFSDIITEKENIVNRCAECKKALSYKTMPYEGVGAYANSIIMMWCASCDLYYMYTEEEDGNKDRET